LFQNYCKKQSNLLTWQKQTYWVKRFRRQYCWK